MKRVYSLLLIVLLVACAGPKKTATIQAEQPDISTQGKLFASLFMQSAAEYHALCLQAYNIAHLRIEEIVRQSPLKPRAIITDLDETVLDNSANEVHQDLQGKGFDPVEWNEWTSKAMADTVPGSFSFFKYAVSKGI